MFRANYIVYIKYKYVPKKERETFIVCPFWPITFFLTKIKQQHQQQNKQN